MTQLRPVQVWVDHFPVVSETFVLSEIRALRALGHRVEVVTLHRAEHPAADGAGERALVLFAQKRLRCALALVWLLARHPRGCLRDRRDRARWARAEVPVPLARLAPAVWRLARDPESRAHAHFAKSAALSAMRASRLLGRPWSLTAHAYDIYLAPANLAEKLRDAALVTSGCDYTVRDLRELAGPGAAGHVHKIVMGVDLERHRRGAPPAERRVVLAIGRLVEKKGFAGLVRAAARPELSGSYDQIVIVGDGPERDALAAQIAALGLAGRVVLAGRLESGAVRDQLEGAAVLAMPCVIAADGDRDSMPVVVKEAMAMELPVVVSDAVGLPEIVRPQFGRVVPAGDDVALADALAELLALPVAERAAMGAAARAFAREHADLHVETAKLSALLEAV